MDRGSLLKIALAAVVASVVAWVYVSGAYEEFDPATMRVWFQDAGAWGGVLFIAAYSLLQPFGLNGLVFLLSAPLIWSPTEAFLLNWAGTVGTGLFSFYGARFVARDWIQQRLPQRIRRFDDRLHTHGFRTVFLLRLISTRHHRSMGARCLAGLVCTLSRRHRARGRPVHANDDPGRCPCRRMDRRASGRVLAMGPTLARLIVAAVAITAAGVFILRKWRATAVD